jgi:hypothetical protein
LLAGRDEEETQTNNQRIARVPIFKTQVGARRNSLKNCLLVYRIDNINAFN